MPKPEKNKDADKNMDEAHKAYHRMVKARVGRIEKEFTSAYELISHYPKSVTFLGSARAKPEDENYQKAEKLAAKIVKDLGYSIVTGGGPGIMEAANKGAFEAGGDSIGLNIRLQSNQKPNAYVTKFEEFNYFFSRKVALTFSAEAYVIFPGGYGTLNEFFEIITLIQTKKIRRAPIILVGEAYWKTIDAVIEETLFKANHFIEEKDRQLYRITDDENEIIQIIRQSPVVTGI